MRFRKDKIQNTKLVFVYGSLRRSKGLYSVMANAEFVGKVRTKPKYTMYSLNVFPCIVEGGKTSIVGELYNISPELEKRLDLIEGVPNLYYKGNVKIKGYSQNILAYFMKAEKVKGLPIIESGDWLS